MIKKVLILSNSSIPLDRQLSNHNFLIKDILFTINSNSDYDYIVVIDDIPNDIKVNISKSKCILFTGEPPFVKLYPKKFRNQFGYIYTCQQNLIKCKNTFLSNPPLPWMTGIKLLKGTHTTDLKYAYLNYNDFIKPSNQDRINKICLITSNKKLTKGHRQRVNFAIKLKEALPDLIDIYGNGFTNMPDKFDVQSKYKYSIVIENCSYPDYWTEKLADTYLAGSYPIYYGANNINNYFKETQLSTINILNFNESLQTIKRIVSEDLYSNRINEIEDAKIMVLDKYNLFNMVTECIEKHPKDENSCRINELKQIRYSIIERIIQRIMRLL